MAVKYSTITREEQIRLNEELENLKTVRRSEIAERIKEAREFGDISENSEYEDAKNEQAMLEGRIIELEQILRNARVIDIDNVSTDKVNVGVVVEIENLDSGERRSYSIVGSHSADPLTGKISDQSPIGKALIGHGEGDEVEIEIPSGLVRYRIIRIGR
ncbi:MAG: transcription elongation factor GreA [Negativicutes bacterium]|nr:transcription elongation factor GreA [Negativicutes bacterium]